jgi:hypothetical protein
MLKEFAKQLKQSLFKPGPGLLSPKIVILKNIVNSINYQKMNKNMLFIYQLFLIM